MNTQELAMSCVSRKTYSETLPFLEQEINRPVRRELEEKVKSLQGKNKMLTERLSQEQLKNIKMRSVLQERGRAQEESQEGKEEQKYRLKQVDSCNQQLKEELIHYKTGIQDLRQQSHQAMEYIKAKIQDLQDKQAFKESSLKHKVQKCIVLVEACSQSMAKDSQQQTLVQNLRLQLEKVVQEIGLADDTIVRQSDRLLTNKVFLEKQKMAEKVGELESELERNRSEKEQAREERDQWETQSGLFKAKLERLSQKYNDQKQRLIQSKDNYIRMKDSLLAGEQQQRRQLEQIEWQKSQLDSLKAQPEPVLLNRSQQSGLSTQSIDQEILRIQTEIMQEME